MKDVLWSCLIVFVFGACANSNNDEQAWNTLNEALDELYNNNYKAYVNYVDSLDVEQVGEDNFIEALKQKFNNKNDSVLFELKDISDIDSTQLLVKYQIVNVNSHDTTFCVQKMKKTDGLWKIKIR